MLTIASGGLPSYRAYSVPRDNDAGSDGPAPDLCANRCQNGGVCVPDGMVVRCDCLVGWEGDSCQLNHDDCAPNPGMNGGTCTDGVAAFSCACGNGFTGASCSIPFSLPAKKFSKAIRPRHRAITFWILTASASEKRRSIRSAT